MSRADGILSVSEGNMSSSKMDKFLKFLSAEGEFISDYLGTMKTLDRVEPDERVEKPDWVINLSKYKELGASWVGQDLILFYDKKIIDKEIDRIMKKDFSGKSL